MRYYFLLSCIFLLIAAILGIFFLYPKYRNLQFKEELALKREKELKTADEYVKNLMDTQQKLAQYQEELLKIEHALPDSLYLPEIISYLQKIGAQSGLLLTKFSFSVVEPKTSSPKTLPFEETFLPSQTTVTQNFKEIKIQLSFTGSYESVKNFLSVLEKSAKIFDCEKISFSLTKEGLILFDLSLKTYSY